MALLKIGTDGIDVLNLSSPTTNTMSQRSLSHKSGISSRLISRRIDNSTGTD